MALHECQTLVSTLSFFVGYDTEPAEGMRIRLVLGQFVSPTLVPKVVRVISLAGNSPSLVRRSTRPSRANTDSPYLKRRSHLSQVRIAQSCLTVPAPRQRHIRNPQTTCLGTMARLMEKRISLLLMTVIPMTMPRDRRRTQLRVGL